jgi:hypothetical protein
MRPRCTGDAGVRGRWRTQPLALGTELTRPVGSAHLARAEARLRAQTSPRGALDHGSRSARPLRAPPRRAGARRAPIVGGWGR